MSEAIVSINGKVMGDLDDLVKQPTEEFTEAMRGLVERAMPPTEPQVADLTTTERAELGRYEAVIKRGLDTFVSVGNALLAIRRDRLYRATHATFEAYCEQRWQLTANFAHKLIGAAEVVTNLQTVDNCTVLPANEAQARPLTKLEPDQQVEAWQKAVEASPDGKPTAAQVTKAAAEFAPAKPPKAKPEPVTHTSMTVIENMVWEWVEKHVRETTHTPLAVLEFLDEGKTTRADKERRQLGAWLLQQGVTWRYDDLSQAIKHVRTRRQQEANQATGKVVYTEHESKASQTTPPEPLSPRQIINTLRTYAVDDPEFADCLKLATVEELGRALDGMDAIGDYTRREWLEGQIRTLRAVTEPASETPLDLLGAGYYIVAPTTDPLWRWVNEKGESAMHGRSEYRTREEAIAEARRHSSCTYPKRPHEEYYPVKHGLAVMPAELIAAGYTLIGADGTEESAGTRGYQWKYGDEVGPNVAYGGLAIEGARAHMAAYGIVTKPAPDPVTPEAPALPDDLAEAGYKLVKVSPKLWAVELAADNYQSNWVFDPADAFADAREYMQMNAPVEMVTLTIERGVASALHAALLIQDVKRGMTPGQRVMAEKTFAKALGI